MLPEEQELVRLEGEQADLSEEVASAELALETTKAEMTEFQRRYYQAVGRLYADLDELDFQIANAQARRRPDDASVQATANAARDQARKSAEEAGLIEAQVSAVETTPELKQAYRQAAKLIHPDRATTDSERERRTALMAEVKRAYKLGDQKAIEKLIVEYGQDPEAIAGADIASRLVKAIRRIAQLRRRLEEVQAERDSLPQTEAFQLKQVIEEAEALGDDPLGDLAHQLTQALSERRTTLESIQQEYATKSMSTVSLSNPGEKGAANFGADAFEKMSRSWHDAFNR